MWRVLYCFSWICYIHNKTWTERFVLLPVLCVNIAKLVTAIFTPFQFQFDFNPGSSKNLHTGIYWFVLTCSCAVDSYRPFDFQAYKKMKTRCHPRWIKTWIFEPFSLASFPVDAKVNLSRIEMKKIISRWKIWRMFPREIKRTVNCLFWVGYVTRISLRSA